MKKQAKRNICFTSFKQIINTYGQNLAPQPPKEPISKIGPRAKILLSHNIDKIGFKDVLLEDYKQKEVENKEVGEIEQRDGFLIEGMPRKVIKLGLMNDEPLRPRLQNINNSVSLIMSSNSHLLSNKKTNRSRNNIGPYENNQFNPEYKVEKLTQYLKNNNLDSKFSLGAMNPSLGKNWMREKSSLEGRNSGKNLSSRSICEENVPNNYISTESGRYNIKKRAKSLPKIRSKKMTPTSSHMLIKDTIIPRFKPPKYSKELLNCGDEHENIDISNTGNPKHNIKLLHSVLALDSKFRRPNSFRYMQGNPNSNYFKTISVDETLYERIKQGLYKPNNSVIKSTQDSIRDLLSSNITTSRNKHQSLSNRHQGHSLRSYSTRAHKGGLFGKGRGKMRENIKEYINNRQSYLRKLSKGGKQSWEEIEERGIFIPPLPTICQPKRKLIRLHKCKPPLDANNWLFQHNYSDIPNI